jgi:hypothetical protein
MTKEYFAGFSLFHGAVRYHDLAYVLATNDELVREEVPHTRIYGLDKGAWGGDDIDWAAVSCDICYAPAERLIVISPEGDVQVSGGGDFLEEKPIAVGKVGPDTRGPLREVRGIAKGRAYACGANRQLYRREASDKWSRVDQSAMPTKEELTNVCFESVDGFSETDIYTVGWEGEVWRFNGKELRKVASPTNLALHAVRCAADGNVYAAGQVGLILKGQGDELEVIEQDETEDHFRSIEWFEDRVFFATGRNLYELVKNKLRPVNWGKDKPRTALRLSAREGRMWSIGAKDIMELRNSRWTRVLKID